MVKTFATWMLSAALAACSKAPPITVVIDGNWNADFAKNSCASIEPRNVCEAERRLGILQFERYLTTQFAAAPECSGIRVVQTSPNAKAPTLPAEYWNLSINYGRDEDAQQHWLMLDSHNQNANQGAGTQNDIAKTVCSVLKRRGAAIEFTS
jgi:hypothetical protein